MRRHQSRHHCPHQAHDGTSAGVGFSLAGKGLCPLAGVSEAPVGGQVELMENGESPRSPVYSMPLRWGPSSDRVDPSRSRLKAKPRSSGSTRTHNRAPNERPERTCVLTLCGSKAVEVSDCHVEGGTNSVGSLTWRSRLMRCSSMHAKGSAGCCQQTWLLRSKPVQLSSTFAIRPNGRLRETFQAPTRST